MTKTKKPLNTAAFSQLGNLYQYLIALERCFELPEGEMMIIERLGDITHSDYQYEIKHHHDKNHQLYDTHVDFWKTLSNWVDNRKILTHYKNFILLTSSSVKEDALVGEWNRLAPSERYEKLKKIHDDIIGSDKDYKTIKKYVKNVFAFSASYAESELTSVLEKIVIKPAYDNASALYERLCNHQCLLAIPFSHRSIIITSLLGFIATKGITSTASWDIEVSEFHEFLRDRADEIRNREIIEYPDLEHTEIGEEYDDHRFIKEIRKIPYLEKVPLAAKDYYFASMTISRLADQNPHVVKVYESEANQLGIELDAKKENACLLITDPTQNNLIKVSKILYNDATHNLKGTEKNTKGAKKEFHRGLIHTHVNSSEFTWKIEESDLED